MIRFFSIAVLFAMTGCGQQSSPEGRLTIRDEQIQAQITLLKAQNKAILDSIQVIKSELKTIRNK
jgi:hypothetical protein